MQSAFSSGWLQQITPAAVYDCAVLAAMPHCCLGLAWTERGLLWCYSLFCAVLIICVLSAVLSSGYLVLRTAAITFTYAIATGLTARAGPAAAACHQVNLIHPLSFTACMTDTGDVAVAACSLPSYTHQMDHRSFPQMCTPSIPVPPCCSTCHHAGCPYRSLRPCCNVELACTPSHLPPPPQHIHTPHPIPSPCTCAPSPPPALHTPAGVLPGVAGQQPDG
jgi:hypothetical protein